MKMIGLERTNCKASVIFKGVSILKDIHGAYHYNRTGIQIARPYLFKAPNANSFERWMLTKKTLLRDLPVQMD